jgi:hypothetical protein
LINLKLTVRSKISALFRGIDDFKKCCQSRRNVVKDEKGDLVTHAHIFLTRWRNYISQLFSVHWVKGVSQTEIIDNWASRQFFKQ